MTSGGIEGALSKDRESFLARRPVSRETLGLLDGYVALLRRWQAAINLIGPATLPEIWTRHILDSLQLIDLAPEARRWVDLGSGAGLPGLILAIALKDGAEAQVVLVESNGKKAGFLRAVARELALPATVRHGRIEDEVPALTGSGIEIVTARALAPLDKLLALAAPLLKTGATGLFPKGRDLDKERSDAAICWGYKADVIQSVVSPGSAILRVTDLVPRGQPA